MFKNKRYPVLSSAFDPTRQAILLIGGVKTGRGNRWYEEAIRTADRLFAEYLRGE